MTIQYPEELLLIPTDKEPYPFYNIMHDRVYHDHIAYLQLYNFNIFRVTVINQVTKQYLCEFFESEHPRFGTSIFDNHIFRKIAADLSDKLLDSYKEKKKEE